MIADFKKNKSKNLLHGIISKIGLGAILIVIVFLVIANVRVYQRKKQLNLQIEGIKSKIEDMKKQNIVLKQEAPNISDQEYIEEIAREELNLQKPGEKVISFVLSEDKPEQNNEEKKGVLDVWLGWLGNTFR